MNKLIALLLCLLLLLSAAACGSSAPDPEPEEPAVEDIPEPEPEPEPFDLDAFKAQVNESVQSIYDNGLYLGNMCTYETNYLKAGASVGGASKAETVLKAAFDWLAEKSDATEESVSAAHELITKQYKEIVLTDVEGAEAEKIKESYEALFEAYTDLHRIALNPAGKWDSFGSEASSAITAFAAAGEDVKLWLE